jgi:glycosyltransferase involved in cell wall biosynthesis
MPPKVSVLILNYNYGRFLGDAVESVLAQDFPGETEILVLDDGSTDDSAERIKPYLDRVSWLPKPNGGQVSAFNYGLARASGNWIALLEADDTWEKDKLSKTFARLEREPGAPLVQHWLLQTDASLKALENYAYPAGPERFTFDDTLVGLPYGGTSCIVFDRARLAPFLPLPESLPYGADICLRWAAASIAPLENIPELLGKRRIHGANLFGRTLYDSPAKVRTAHAFHAELFGYLDRVVSLSGVRPSPESLRHISVENAQLELFFLRYERGAAAAFSGWLALAALLPFSAGSAFKILSTLLIVLSPGLYLRLQNFYAGLRSSAEKKHG